jgi:hypothetical protein
VLNWGWWRCFDGAWTRSRTEADVIITSASPCVRYAGWLFNGCGQARHTVTADEQAASTEATTTNRHNVSAAAKREPEISLEALHAALCGGLPPTARTTLVNATGEPMVDDIITIGYWHVNSGRLEPAITIFEQVLLHRPLAVPALLGLGSAFAMLVSVLGCHQNARLIC